MKVKEKAVRDAAAALSSALKEAKADGFIVVWPSRADGLDTIEISETSKTPAAAPRPAPARAK